MLCLSLLIVVIDNTVLNTALPTLARVLHAGTGSLQWITDAFSLVFAALLITAGALGDRFGRRRALAGGLALYAVGSIGAALASGTTTLIVCRSSWARPRVRHARHPVHPQRRLPRRGAGSGHRRLVGRGRGRRRDRPDPGRIPPRPLRLGQRVLGQCPPGRVALAAAAAVVPEIAARPAHGAASTRHRRGHVRRRACWPSSTP